MTTIDDAELSAVTGANGWDALDKGVGSVYPGWNKTSCPARANYVGWTLGTGLGAAQWSTWKKFGPKGQAILGPINGLITTAAASSYENNCEQKSAAKK